MGQINLPPPPRSSDISREYNDWFVRVHGRFTDLGQVLWEQVDKATSALDDIVDRSHSLLQNVLGADDTDTDATKVRHVSNLMAKGWTDHGALTTAHGSTGAVVGVGDLATISVYGVVKKATASTDAAASTVSVDAVDATNLATAITLVNECKADINSLVTDVNVIQASLNDLKAVLRTSGVLTT